MSTQTDRGIWITIGFILLFMALVVGSFINRVQQPRIMPVSEMRANGLFLFDTPRDPGEFRLVDHHGKPFTEVELEGRWTLLFFGLLTVPISARRPCLFSPISQKSLNLPRLRIPKSLW